MIIKCSVQGPQKWEKVPQSHKYVPVKLMVHYNLF